MSHVTLSETVDVGVATLPLQGSGLSKVQASSSQETEQPQQWHDQSDLNEEEGRSPASRRKGGV